MTWIIAVVGVLVGIALAILVFSVIIGEWYVGDLREQPDPEEAGSYYFMEIAKGGLERIRKSKFVVLRVRKDGYMK